MIRFGVDQVAAKLPGELRDARAGLVTNDVALTTDGRRSRAALKEGGLRLTRLFGPEHGLSAAAADGDHVGDSVDALTGAPVTSLYGKTQRPSKESLADVDVLMFDIPDVGARFYTYIWTLSHVLEAAAEAGKPLWVLDRPNPIGGDLALAEGPVLDEGFVSTFVGRWSMPIRHCLTVGELARVWNAERRIGADLHVVRVEGWKREDHWPALGVKFTPPSPNMPSYESALLYPGTCLIEGTNVSEGRGTEAAFQLVGAPWVEGEVVAEMLNALAFDGVRTSGVEFTPASRKFAGQRCSGVRFEITDGGKVRSVSVGLALIGILARLYPDYFEWFPPANETKPAGSHFQRLVGRPEVLDCLDARTVELKECIRRWTGAGDWAARVTPHLMYA
jgi:uncharacterized protein YbbC (DUF1343 family)